MRPRAENVAEAQALRSDGMPVKEIAAQMGVNFKTVYEWLSDPLDVKSSQRKRARERVVIAARSCEKCGGPVGCRTAVLCQHCFRHQRDELAAEMVRLREAGMTNIEIAAHFAISRHNVAQTLSRRRTQRGLSVPRPPYWNRKRDTSMQNIAVTTMQRDLERSRETLAGKERQCEELRLYIAGLEAALAAFEAAAGSANGATAA